MPMKDGRGPTGEGPIGFGRKECFYRGRKFVDGNEEMRNMQKKEIEPSHQEIYEMLEDIRERLIKLEK
jgi:hypothetical protein